MHAWHSRLYLSKAGTRFSDPGGMLGWVDLVVWLWGYEELLSGCILMRDWRMLWVQSLLRLHEEMVAEGCIHNELVNTALPVCQRHDSVTTASQTDLSGEVSLRHTCKHAPVSLICMSWEAPDLFTRQCSKGHYWFCMCLSFRWASCMNGWELRCYPSHIRNLSREPEEVTTRAATHNLHEEHFMVTCLCWILG